MWRFAVLWCYVEGVITVKVAARGEIVTMRRWMPEHRESGYTVRTLKVLETKFELLFLHFVCP